MAETKLYRVYTPAPGEPETLLYWLYYFRQESVVQAEELLEAPESLARLLEPKPEPEQWTPSPEEAEEIASILAEVGALEAVLTAQGAKQ